MFLKLPATKWFCVVLGPHFEETRRVQCQARKKLEKQVALVGGYHTYINWLYLPKPLFILYLCRTHTSLSKNRPPPKPYDYHMLSCMIVPIKVAIWVPTNTPLVCVHGMTGRCFPISRPPEHALRRHSLGSHATPSSTSPRCIQSSWVQQKKWGAQCFFSGFKKRCWMFGCLVGGGLYHFDCKGEFHSISMFASTCWKHLMSLINLTR